MLESLISSVNESTWVNSITYLEYLSCHVANTISLLTAVLHINHRPSLSLDTTPSLFLQDSTMFFSWWLWATQMKWYLTSQSVPRSCLTIDSLQFLKFLNILLRQFPCPPDNFISLSFHPTWGCTILCMNIRSTWLPCDWVCPKTKRKQAAINGPILAAKEQVLEFQVTLNLIRSMSDKTHQ